MTNKPFSPESLARRWGCSNETIRQMCKRGELAHFKLGKLYRIPFNVVENIECPTLPSEDSEEVSVFPGQIQKQADEDAISFRHAPERKLKQKP